MLKRVFGWVAPLCLGLLLTTAAAAQSQGLKKGPEISTERKSEQGLEHGKAYAGTKEKKDASETDDQNMNKKAKKDKAEKKMKEEKLEKEKVAKKEKDKLERQKDESKEKDKIKDKMKSDLGDKKTTKKTEN